ncbi:MAG: CoA transferase subunit A [Rubrobacteraceae bacterium]|nr:CoA transferase subunit A [Rubrobacteraceae bacterium]
MDSGTNQDKRYTLKDAIARYVHSGDSLYLAGMAHGEPSAAVHEILRQEITDLTLIRPVSEVPSLLISEGRVKVLTHAYTSVLYSRRGYMALRTQELGYVPELIEFSHFGLNLALQAGAMGIPYMPTISQLGSDIMTCNTQYLAEARDPFTSQKVAVVRAITPDVGIVHVQRADKFGNAQKWGTLGMDSAGLHASNRVIVTAEKIVDSEEIRQSPEHTLIPGALVSAVVEEPWGAYPRHLYGYYADDVKTFLDQVSTKENYEEYVAEFVYGVSCRTEMMEKMRQRFGDKHFEELSAVAKQLTPLR